jgi:hypothetical protein
LRSSEDGRRRARSLRCTRSFLHPLLSALLEAMLPPCQRPRLVLDLDESGQGRQLLTLSRRLAVGLTQHVD